MAKKSRLIIAEPELTELPPVVAGREKNIDSSGFGLVVWLFDHINDRRPVFLSLYQQYDLEVKISSNHKILNRLFLVAIMLFDGLVFLVYAGAVISIIIGITFIFVKGTGILDYVQGLATGK